MQLGPKSMVRMCAGRLVNAPTRLSLACQARTQLCPSRLAL